MVDNSELVGLVKRTNDLLLVLVKAQMREVLERELTDTKRKKLYELTGAGIPTKTLSQRVGMATGIISETWQRWEQVGMLVKEKGKYRRIL